MKKIVFILSISMLIFSCSDNQLEQEPTSQSASPEFEVPPFPEDENKSNSQSSQLARADLQDYNQEEIRKILRSISLKQRYNLWMDKLNQVLTTDLTESQRGAILEMIGFMSESTFEWEGEDYNYFTKTYLPVWYNNYSSHFSQQEGTSIFYNLIDFDPWLNDIANKSGETPKCNCDQSSFLGSCQFSGSICSEYDCGKNSWGCGFIGLFNCNGMCEKDMIDPNPRLKDIY
ncbi:MAG: hypothetical protein ACI8ZN_002125 [Bacteroidia bacterium]|jgi:hypothetical protein